MLSFVIFAASREKSLRAINLGKTTKDQRRVRAAEAEGGRHHMRYLLLARRVGNVVEVAGGIGRFVVDRRRDDFGLSRHRGDGSFDPASATEAYRGRRITRADRTMVC